MKNYKWIAFLAVTLSLFVSVMSMGAILISLKDISESFNTPIHQVSWLVIVHLLTVTAILLPAGNIADRFGRKNIHIFGILIFILGTIIGVFANSFEVLIFSRIIMAIGSGMGQSVGGAIVSSLFPESERGKSLGMMSTSVGLGQMFGPVLGGVLVYNFGWVYVYLFLLIPMILALILGYFLLRPDNLSSNRKDDYFDFKGTLFGVSFIVTLIVGLKNLSIENIFSNYAFIFLILSIPFCIAFIITELRISNPILNFGLFKKKNFSLAINTRLFAFMSMSADMIMMPIFLTGLLSINESEVGFMLIFGALAFAISAPIGGRLSDQFGRKKFIILGLLMLIFSYTMISQFNINSSKKFITIFLVIGGVGKGLWGSPNMALTYSSLSKNQYSFVSSIISFIRNMGNTLGQTYATVILSVFLIIGANYNGDISGLGSLEENSINIFLNAWKFIYISSVVFLLISLIPNIFVMKQKQI